MSNYEPSLTPRIYNASISVREHRDLRDAIDAAREAGTQTWIKNSDGEPVAAIVPASLLRDYNELTGVSDE